MEIIKIRDEENFKSEIEKGIVIVDFFATWCGPCKMLSPILDGVANKRDDVKICKVDVDENYELAKSFGIMSVPTVLFFKNGSLANKKIGLLPEEQINEIIEEIK